MKKSKLSLAGKLMELENILLGEISQIERQILHALSHRWVLNIEYELPEPGKVGRKDHSRMITGTRNN